MLYITILILSIILAVLILGQAPKQDTLGTAFNGDEIHVSKVERRLFNSTMTIYSLIVAILIYNMFF